MKEGWKNLVQQTRLKTNIVYNTTCQCCDDVWRLLSHLLDLNMRLPRMVRCSPNVCRYFRFRFKEHAVHNTCKLWVENNKISSILFFVLRLLLMSRDHLYVLSCQKIWKIRDDCQKARRRWTRRCGIIYKIP